MTEKFKIINNAGDYHLMNGDEELCYDLCSPTMMPDNWNKVVDKLNKQDKIIKDKEELIKAKNQQLENVKQILTYHKKLISYMEEGLCAPARLQLIKQILNELGWD